MIKLIKNIAIFLLVSFVVYVLIALSLIGSESPAENPGQSSEGEGLKFERLLSVGNDLNVPLQTYKTRDGSQLSFRRINAELEGAPLVILIHGSGWHGGAYLGLAKHLSSKADVLIPDLRGHGHNPIRRGDIDYIGQFEADITDLIAQQKKPDQKVILVGHSSGGGLAIRYAGGQYGNQINAAILLAPYLKYDAPTARPDSGGWAHVLTRRIIGLSMLNQIGVTQLNHLPIIQFTFPDKVLNGKYGATATKSYSYRLNISFAPRDDYLSDISKLPPFLLLVGKQDEAFHADQYQPVMSKVNNKGSYIVLPGIAHLDIINASKTKEAIMDFLNQSKFQ